MASAPCRARDSVRFSRRPPPLHADRARTRWNGHALRYGGSQQSSATATAAAGAAALSSADLQQQAQDAYFDYDKSDIRDDARDALTRDAALLKQIFAQYPNFSVVVEGHCDERGSAEYNLALGDRRATAAKDFLVQLGVPADN